MYESHYGLDAKPFQLTPDPKFFFASKLHKRALSYLQYGLSQGEGFIVITGDIGTGKTTLANSLLANIETDIVADDRTPDSVCRAIEAYKGEVLPTSPTFLNLLLLSKAYEHYDLASLKLITYRTEPM